LKITSRLTSITSKVLDRIEAAAIPVIALPWHGSMVCVKIRELNQTQILACGDFSLIETFKDKVRQKKNKLKRGDVMAYAEAQHAIARAALMSPTYDEIMDRIGKGKDIDAKKAELAELQASLQSCPQGPQRSALEEEIDSYRIWIDLIFPTDFLSALVAYCLGINKSDIKNVSEKMLLDAAILAEKGHDNPHDHLQGEFTEFNKHDIDVRAWMILEDFKEEQKNGPAKPEI
jgi:hypothetical protein